MITITDGKLKMNDVLIDDQDIVQFFAGIKADDGCDLEMIYSEVLIRALKIGISALHRAQTQVDIDTIRREFTQLHGQMGTALERYFGDNGKLNKLLEDVLTGDHSDFALKLDYTEDQSPLKKLYKAFEARMKEIDGRIVEVQNKLSEQKGRQQAEELGTRQGFEFENVLEQVLCKVAKPYKDEVIFVGSESGNGRSKKGDLLIEINPGDVDGKKARIVIEAKRDASKSIRGKTGILIEIEDAKANRQADFAIAVYSRDACPSEVGQLRDYGNNRLVCSIPADGSEPLVLEVAYILARTEVCWQKRHQSGRFDRAQARQVLHSIQEKLDRFQGIKTKATNISNLADDLRKDLANVEKEIRECVELALRELEVDSAS